MDGRFREEHAAERLHGIADQDRQKRDEDRAEDRAEHRAEPADDDHRQVVDRHADLELLVVRDPEEVGVEHAGDAGVERRDGEGEQFVAEDVDADDLGRDVVVANGDEGAAHPRAEEVQGPHDGEDDEDPDVHRG